MRNFVVLPYLFSYFYASSNSSQYLLPSGIYARLLIEAIHCQRTAVMGRLHRVPASLRNKVCSFILSGAFSSASSARFFVHNNQHALRGLIATTPWLIKKKLLSTLIVVCSLLGVSALTHGSIVIDRAIVHFLPGEANRQDVEIYNPDAEPVYLQVELLKVSEPGTDNETRTSVEKGADIEFLATPDKLVIPPKGRKRVRLVVVKPNANHERVYRVNLKPVVGKIEADQTAIKVVVGYQLLVLVQPIDVVDGLRVERAGKRLMVENTGNVNVYVRTIKQCNPNKSDECEESAPFRLYAGNLKTIDLKWDSGAELSLSQSLQNSSRTVE